MCVVCNCGFTLCSVLVPRQLSKCGALGQQIVCSDGLHVSRKAGMDRRGLCVKSYYFSCTQVVGVDLSLPMIFKVLGHACASMRQLCLVYSKRRSAKPSLQSAIHCWCSLTQAGVTSSLAGSSSTDSWKTRLNRCQAHLGELRVSFCGTPFPHSVAPCFSE